MQDSESSRVQASKEGSVSWKDTSRPFPGLATLRGDPTEMGRLALRAVGLVAVIAAANILGGHAGSTIAPGVPAGSAPALTPAFQGHLAWLNVWWGVALLLTVARLAHGRWSLVLRWADLGVSLLGILAAFRMLVAGPLLGYSSGWLAASMVDTVQMASYQLPLMNRMLEVALLGMLLALAAGLVRKLAELVRTTHVASWDIDRGWRYLAGLALGLGLSAPGALLLGSAAYLGLALPLGLVLGAVLDRHTENIFT